MGGSVPHIAAMVVTTVSTAAGVKCPVLYTHYTSLVHYTYTIHIHHGNVRHFSAKKTIDT